MNRDGLRRAACEGRNVLFAELLTVTIGLAAETYPEELRKALATVFDLRAVEEQTNRMMLVLARLQNDVRDLRWDVQQLRKEFEAIPHP